MIDGVIMYLDIKFHDCSLNSFDLGKETNFDHRRHYSSCSRQQRELMADSVSRFMFTAVWEAVFLTAGLLAGNISCEWIVYMLFECIIGKYSKNGILSHHTPLPVKV